MTPIMRGCDIAIRPHTMVPSTLPSVPEPADPRHDATLRRGVQACTPWALLRPRSAWPATPVARVPQPAPDDGLLGRLRDEVGYLAGSALRGRGSATHDELVTALHLGSKLQELGIAPAGDNGSFVQDVPLRRTRNVIGVLRGSESPDEVILLSAHMDHLGTRWGTMYPGADDDASGCAAVLELARALAQGEPPKRTVMFVFFGSEETGGAGNQYFLARPPVPLAQIVANLEFEMIGRPDPAVERDTLWLTGFQRSDLGAELARHGAKLVNDPHPSEDFFRRSDNYALARKGIVAHTVSSFGLHADYHRPTDTVDRIDFEHMARTIASIIEPVAWLASSPFKPRWAPGQDPSQSRGPWLMAQQPSPDRDSARSRSPRHSATCHEPSRRDAA